MQNPEAAAVPAGHGDPSGSAGRALGVRAAGGQNAEHPDHRLGEQHQQVPGAEGSCVLLCTKSGLLGTENRDAHTCACTHATTYVTDLEKALSRRLPCFVLNPQSMFVMGQELCQTLG